MSNSCTFNELNELIHELEKVDSPMYPKIMFHQNRSLNFQCRSFQFLLDEAFSFSQEEIWEIFVFRFPIEPTNCKFNFT